MTDDASGKPPADDESPDAGSEEDGMFDLGMATHALYDQLGETRETEREQMAAESLARQAELDRQFDEAQLPDSVIPELSHDGIVDPWGGPPPDEPTPPKVGALSSGINLALLIAGAVLVGLVLWFALSGGDDETAETESDSPSSETGDQADGDDDGVDAGAPAAASDDTASADDGESTSGELETWVATEAPSGWGPWDEFDATRRDIERGGYLAGDVMDATTLISMAVTSDGSSKVEVAFDFAGDAKSLQEVDGIGLDGGIGFIGSDGRYWDILWYDDQTYKISDKPTTASIEALWESSNRMLFIIEGVGVVPGNVVALTLFLDLFAGINIQTAEVAIN